MMSSLYFLMKLTTHNCLIMFGHLLCKSPMISVASYLIVSSIDGSMMANQQTKIYAHIG